MDLWIALILIVGFLIVLHMSSGVTITNAIKVSEITGLGKSTVGFSLIAFSTSLPEFCVAFVSAFTGETAVSVGNVLGSNIVNINLIVGLAALIISLRHKGKANMVSSFAKGELVAFILVYSYLP